MVVREEIQKYGWQTKSIKACLAHTWKSAVGLLEEEDACSTFSEAYSLWESMTAALPWAYRSSYTLAFLCFDDWCEHTHTHTCVPASKNQQAGFAHTHTYIFTSSPTWINSPASPAAAMMSPAILTLQRHKKASMLKAQRANATSHLVLCPSVP